MAALQASMAKDMDKYTKGHFDYASFDAQVFGKQAQMASDQSHESSHFPDCECVFCFKSKVTQHALTLLFKKKVVFSVIKCDFEQYMHSHLLQSALYSLYQAL